jgi:hypothetical protein
MHASKLTANIKCCNDIPDQGIESGRGPPVLPDGMYASLSLGSNRLKLPE